MTSIRAAAGLCGFCLVFWAVAGVQISSVCQAQTSEPAPASPDSSPPASDAEAGLAGDQARVAKRYEELQQALLKMAEVTSGTDPRRAAILRQAYTRSTELAIEQKFDGLVELLEKDQLYQASKDQTQLQRDLAAVLELLLSGDSEKLPDEKARMAEILKQVNRLIKEQKGLQGQTAGDADAKPLADKQGQLAEKTGKLQDSIAEGEKQSSSQGNDSKPSEPKPSDSPPEDQDGKPQEGGEPQKGGSQKGEPQDGAQPSPDGEQSAEQNEGPQAQKRIESAAKKMRAAEEKLREAQKKPAFEEQQKALEELEMAKAELEKILRQLREEEIDRMLTMLEARFRKMLAMQTEVYEGTQRLASTPVADRTREDEIEAGRLSRREAEIVAEADKALALMREDGSAVAFPEAVLQIRTDMQQVVELLAQADTGELTVSLEQDVLAAIEEMLAALEQAKQQNEEQKPQAPGQPGEPTEAALVDQLSELKMIRTLQSRVNNRTVQYSKMLQKPASDRSQLKKGLDELADRQARIHGATRDIVTGRNK